MNKKVKELNVPLVVGRLGAGSRAIPTLLTVPLAVRLQVRARRWQQTYARPRLAQRLMARSFARVKQMALLESNPRLACGVEAE